MRNPNAVVSSEIRLDPPLDRPPDELLRAADGIAVELEGGRRLRLDPDDPRSAGFAQVLHGLSQQHRPVYVEFDPDTSAISRLLIPHVARVVGIRLIDPGVLAVELDRSHARHVLRQGSPDFDELEAGLREALRAGEPGIVTEDDAHEILDIRSYRPGPGAPPPPFRRPEALPRRPWPWRWIHDLIRWPWWPWMRFGCVSSIRAQQVFDDLSATSCNPLTVPPPCIPFLYPDDGCWARAHEMCRLMINMGLSPKKVWIDGSLYASTKNTPHCYVSWNWHVAPTLCVRTSWWLRTERMVMDPALFTTPVSKAAWKGGQGDLNATLTDTAASIYYRATGATDPTYTDTNLDLAFYRMALLDRSVQFGPPPYADCP